jgi:hypothetical protein
VARLEPFIALQSDLLRALYRLHRLGSQVLGDHPLGLLSIFARKCTTRQYIIVGMVTYLASEKPGCDWPNPIIYRRHRLKTGSHLPRDLPDDDVVQLFAAIPNERDRAVFGLMVGAGLWVDEMATLHLDNVEEPTEPGRLARLQV